MDFPSTVCLAATGSTTRQDGVVTEERGVVGDERHSEVGRWSFEMGSYVTKDKCNTEMDF